MSIEHFHFLRPAWLLALLGLIPLFWAVRRNARTAGAWHQLCDAPLLRHLLIDAGGRASRWPVAALGGGWLAASLALAGPSWERLPQPAFQAPDHTALVLDLSRSMRARDVTPDRITRARYEMLDLLDQIDGAVGLVIYAEEPYAVTPLTDDPRVIASMVPTLETGLMPGRGDRLDRAIDEAHELLARAGATRGRIIVLGDSLGDQPKQTLAAAERAADAGFRVGVLGIGGNADALERLARAGGGVFAAHAADDSDLEAMLSIRAAPLAAGEDFEAGGLHTDTWRDMGAWLVLLPLLLAPFAFRRGWAGAIGLALLVSGGAPEARAEGIEDWFARPDQRGAEAFTAGEHATAAELFEEPNWRAAAQYRAGDYERALASLDGLESPLAHYNRGNALARAGQLEPALAAYDEVLASESEHDDARHNRDLVQQLLDQQQQPQPSSGDGVGQESDESQSGEDSQRSDPGEGGGQSDPNQSQESESAEGGEPNASGEGNASADSQSARSDPASGTDANEGSDPQTPDPDSTGSAAADRPEGRDQDEAKENAKAGLEEDLTDGPSPSETAGADTGGDPTAPGTGGAATANPPSTRDSSNPSDREPGRAGSGGRTPREFTEQDQEIEQRLNRVPDDPGGLLREKLRRRYAQKRYSMTYGR